MATRTERRLHVQIRWMIRRDYPEILDIEADSFECGWTEEDFKRAARQRNTIGMVAERGGKIVGYMVYELHERHLHLLTLAVAPAFRGRSIGRQMVNKLAGKLDPGRRTHLTIELPETNLGGQLFFRACGFRWISTTRCTFGDDDGYLMRLELE